jgi:hypothetical protein
MGEWPAIATPLPTPSYFQRCHMRDELQWNLHFAQASQQLQQPMLATKDYRHQSVMQSL